MSEVYLALRAIFNYVRIENGTKEIREKIVARWEIESDGVLCKILEKIMIDCSYGLLLKVIQNEAFKNEKVIQISQRILLRRRQIEKQYEQRILENLDRNLDKIYEEQRLERLMIIGAIKCEQEYESQNSEKGLSSLEILATLQCLPIQTHGVYPSDKIPKVWKKPAVIVSNTDDHTKPGKHWVAMYVDEHGNGYYFDSFGTPPCVGDHIIEYLRSNSLNIIFSSRRIQSVNSVLCGHFCVMFCQFLANGLSMQKFQSFFGFDFVKNDQIAKDFYCRLMKDKDIIKKEIEL